MGSENDDHPSGVPAGCHGLSESIAQRLPPAYLSALEGIAASDDDLALAARTGVDPAAVHSLVRLALAKLLDAQTPTVPEPVTHEAGSRGDVEEDGASSA